MPQVLFVPAQKSVEVAQNTKLLLAGRKAGADLRFGCASCRCGTCGVKILESTEALSPLKKDEELLLLRLKLPIDGTVRLACQARVIDNCTIDLAFQDSYSPGDVSIIDAE